MNERASKYKRFSEQVKGQVDFSASSNFLERLKIRAGSTTEAPRHEEEKRNHRINRMGLTAGEFLSGDLSLAEAVWSEAGLEVFIPAAMGQGLSGEVNYGGDRRTADVATGLTLQAGGVVALNVELVTSDGKALFTPHWSMFRTQLNGPSPDESTAADEPDAERDNGEAREKACRRASFKRSLGPCGTDDRAVGVATMDPAG